MPGIIGSKDGKRHVSAGIFPHGDSKTASVPTMKAAIVLAATICILKREELSIRKRAECPTAAMMAQKR